MKCEDCKIRRCENFGGIINRIYHNYELPEEEKLRRLVKAASRHHLVVKGIGNTDAWLEGLNPARQISVECIEKNL